VKLHNSYFSLCNFGVVKSGRLIWAGHEVNFSATCCIGLVYDPVVKLRDEDNDDNGDG